MSIYHVVLEADKNNKPVFYNTLAFDHRDYDISSSTPDKEYLKKVHRLATGGMRISIVVKNCLIFMKCDKETIGRVLIACMMFDFYQIICQENGFLTRSLQVCFQDGNTTGYLSTTKRIWNSALNPHQ